MNKITRYLVVGFKLFVVLILAGLVMAIPRFAVLFLSVDLFSNAIIQIVMFILGLIVAGWLVIKFKRWIFK